MVADTLVVAYTSWTRDPTGRRYIDESRTFLHCVRWTPDGALRDSILAVYPVPARATPGPRLAAVGDTLHLVVGIRDEAQVWAAATGRPMPERGSFVRFDSWKSTSAGRTWERDGHLPLPGEIDLGEFGKVGDVGWSPDLALGASHAGALAVWGFAGLYRHRRIPGGEWDLAARMDSGPVAEPDTPGGLSSIQAIQVAGRDVVLWISLAHTRRDLAWLGVPSWKNNDVYVSALPSLGGDQPGAAFRLTTSTPYTGTLRARVLGDSLYVLRAGSEKVGRALPAFNPRSDLVIAVCSLQDLYRLFP